MEIYLEGGAKRTFAVALAWPGWARAGRDESAALEALVRAGSRYAAALRRTRLGFRAPPSVDELVVVERVRGTATTDFGAPDVTLRRDRAQVEDPELGRFVAILRACWRAFDGAVARAQGIELSKGPRGGGRALGAIVDHVLGADEAYLRMIGGAVPRGEERDTAGRALRVRAASASALERAVRHGVEPGPRGGARWVPRYFVRRSAWHVLDHAWEIEDRAAETRPVARTGRAGGGSGPAG